MHILLIKTSSMGDVFHTFPALTDAMAQIPNLKVTWVVEEAFAQLPLMHPAVSEVIPVAWRRWRKNLLNPATWQQMRQFKRKLRRSKYDVVLDAQCLIKSALIASRSGQAIYGLDKNSAREPLAAKFYKYPISVRKGQHAIARVRELFAKSLGYWQDSAPISEQPIQYGLEVANPPNVSDYGLYGRFWMGLHGTTWETKLYPESHWVNLAKLASSSDIQLVLPWGNQEELDRATRLGGQAKNIVVLPKMGLVELIGLMSKADAVVGVDTGLSHVAAALEMPAVAIYGATDPKLTAVKGPAVNVMSSDFACAPCMSKHCKYNQAHPPCYDRIPADTVYQDIIQRL